MAAAPLPVAPPTTNTQTSLEKIEGFVTDSLYKETIESAVNYNTRLCLERRLRLPFIDTQTGLAQNHCSLFMNKRQRLPGLLPGQIYSYPRQRWRKKRRQYLTINARAFARAADAMMDGESDMHNISQIENPALQDTDSKDSQLLLKDEVSKEWFYDEQDMLEMDTYDEPDPDSDLDYEETYRQRKRGKRASGRGRTDSPSTPGRRKGAGRGRGKKGVGGHSFEPTPGDPDKPFACELCGARYKTRPGLTYHYGHSHKEGASDENSRDSNAPLPPAAPVPSAPSPSMGMGVPPPPGGPLPGGGAFPGLQPGGPPLPGPMPPMGPAPGPPPAGGGALDMNATSPHAHQHGPSQGHVYQDSYVSFLNQTPGTPSRRGRPNGPPGQGSPMGQPPPPPMPGIPPHHPQMAMPPQIPPTLPPNLPPNQGPPPGPMDDPPMPILKPERALEPPPQSIAPHPQMEVCPEPQPMMAAGPEKKVVAPSPYCDFCLGDSTQNKKTGGVEELVSCSDCGRSECCN
ncbi:zinc finger protein ubi-d4 A-like isoform X2 [Cylas formicarius]|uniref:zinc finger protein ubi-d4 A-like isoform X2 n=1 Tax=Cylas formicarius TaxID=197179 RepID=UPI002958CA50|nr:zinc finger protein ubi-d4 A-like isoform X2 [Cylas formicarius]